MFTEYECHRIEIENVFEGFGQKDVNTVDKRTDRREV
jgi:hypothetical protein